MFQQTTTPPLLPIIGFQVHYAWSLSKTLFTAVTSKKEIIHFVTTGEANEGTQRLVVIWTTRALIRR